MNDFTYFICKFAHMNSNITQTNRFFWELADNHLI